VALIPLGESKRRMLRRVLRNKRCGFDDARTQVRKDREHFDWMVEQGVFV
jgi:hypothetical protein